MVVVTTTSIAKMVATSPLTYLADPSLDPSFASESASMQILSDHRPLIHTLLASFVPCLTISPDEWSFLLDETMTYARAFLIICITSRIGDRFSTLITTHATAMFSSTICFFSNASFSNDPGSSSESFHSSRTMDPPMDVTAMLLHQVLEGGLLGEELQEDVEVVDVKKGGEGGLGKVGLERMAEDGGGGDEVMG